MQPLSASAKQLHARAARFQTESTPTSASLRVSTGFQPELVTSETTPSHKPSKKAASIRKSHLNSRSYAVLSEAPNTPVIIGRCQDLEKDYYRLTSLPDASTIRPEAVLRRALPHALQEWKLGHRDYTWFCSQVKAIRQDMHIQRIRNAFSVRVYEVHADAAVTQGDLGELQQCLALLVQLYDATECEISQLEASIASGLISQENQIKLSKLQRMVSRNEIYRAYAIVVDAAMRRNGGGASAGAGSGLTASASSGSLLESTQPSSDSMVATSFMDQMVDQETTRASHASMGLSQTAASSLRPIALAGAIQRAGISGNYIQFFRCYRAAWPRFKRLLALTSLESWRLKAITAIFAAYRPTVPAAWFARLMALDADRSKDDDDDDDDDDEDVGNGAQSESERKVNPSNSNPLETRVLFDRLRDFLKRFGIAAEPNASLATSLQQLQQSRQLDTSPGATKMTKAEKSRLIAEISERQYDLEWYVINIRDSLTAFATWQTEHNKAIEEAQTSILRPEQSLMMSSGDGSGNSSGGSSGHESTARPTKQSKKASDVVEAVEQPRTPSTVKTKKITTVKSGSTPTSTTKATSQGTASKLLGTTRKQSGGDGGTRERSIQITKRVK